MLLCVADVSIVYSTYENAALSGSTYLILLRLLLPTTAQTAAETLDEGEEDGEEEDDYEDEGDGMETVGEAVHANAVDVEGLCCVHDHLGRVAL